MQPVSRLLSLQIKSPVSGHVHVIMNSLQEVHVNITTGMYLLSEQELLVRKRSNQSSKSGLTLLLAEYVIRKALTKSLQSKKNSLNSLSSLLDFVIPANSMLRLVGVWIPLCLFSYYN